MQNILWDLYSMVLSSRVSGKNLQDGHDGIKSSYGFQNRQVQNQNLENGKIIWNIELKGCLAYP